MPPLLGSTYAHQNLAQHPRNTSASASLPSERLTQRLFSIINLAGPPLPSTLMGALPPGITGLPSYTLRHSLHHHSHYNYHSTLKDVIGISLATGHVIISHMLCIQLRYQTRTNRHLVCVHLLQYIGRVDPAPVPHLDLLSHWGQVSTSCTRWSSQYTQVIGDSFGLHCRPPLGLFQASSLARPCCNPRPLSGFAEGCLCPVSPLPPLSPPPIIVPTRTQCGPAPPP